MKSKIFRLYLNLRKNEILDIFIYKFKFYTHIKPILKFQLSNYNTNKSILGPKILIPLIETTHYQYLQILIIAKALQIRGAEVKILVCDGYLDACEIKSVKNSQLKNPCFKCMFNVKNLLPNFNFEIITLNEIKESLQKEQDTNINLNQCIEDSVIRYFYGAIPEENEIVQEIRSKHQDTALLMSKIAIHIDKIWKPDIVLNSMYCYSAWEPFYTYYSNNCNRFKSISITQFDFNKIVLNSFELFSSNRRYLNYLKARKNSILFDFEEKILDDFIYKRFTGETQIFKKDNYFVDNSLNNNLELFLNINKKVKNVFIFSNIYWDIGLSSCAGLYADVVSWVIETIEICKDNNNIHLYIKPHPGEVFDSSSSLKGISQIIKEKYKNLPKNITIIEPEFKIKTYDLFKFIDLGIIFNGTLGLEMMLSGIPVISTGKTSHYGLQLSHEPTSKAEYLELIQNLNRKTKIDINNVRMFAYFYFIRTLIPFDLTKQAYADDFKNGYTFRDLGDLEVGKNKNLDHLCSCILNDEIVPEIW